MTDQAAFERPYYAKDGMVWKHPVKTGQPGGGVCISIGFPICKMTDVVGNDAAEAVAELMNAGHNAPRPPQVGDTAEPEKAVSDCCAYGDNCPILGGPRPGCTYCGNSPRKSNDAEQQKD